MMKLNADTTSVMNVKLSESLYFGRKRENNHFLEKNYDGKNKNLFYN